MAEIELTEEQKAAYLATGGLRCPLCLSKDLEGDELAIDGPQATSEATCNSCDARWTDVYKLVDVVDVEDLEDDADEEDDEEDDDEADEDN